MLTVHTMSTYRVRAGVAALMSALLAVGLCGPVSARPADNPAASTDSIRAAPDTAAQDRALARLLDRRIRDSRIGKNFAMRVIDGETGREVYAHGPDNPQRAASNTKMVVAVTALATMSQHKAFTTYSLRASNGKDVILQGGGDPLLSRSQITSLADRTAAKLKRGSRVVVHMDLDLFYKMRRGRGWTPGYSNYLIAGVQALAFYGDHSHYPAKNVASVFVNRLRAKGIRAVLGKAESASSEARVLAKTKGHTVAQSVAVMLSRSESNIAEVLFRQAAVASGFRGSWNGGIKATKRVMNKLGVPMKNVAIYDGSGLSRKDRLTPRFLTEMLRAVKVLQGSRFKAMFAPHAMPIAGRTGTLATPYGRYDTYPSRCAAGRVQAKTGTLYDAIALSGVSKTVSGRTLLFSMIINSRPSQYEKLANRRALDGLAATITGCWK